MTIVSQLSNVFFCYSKNLILFLYTTIMLSLIPLILIHALAVISPGPDLVMIIQQSLIHGRKSALRSSLWLGTGIAIHSSYCIVGIAALLQLYPQVIIIIQLLGAGYLIYLGYSWICTSNSKFQTITWDKSDSLHIQSSRSAYRQWLMTNLLNPKVTLFLLILYSTVQLVLSQQVILWVAMSLNTAIWFMIVGSVLTIPRIQQQFVKIIPYVTIVLSCLMMWLWIWIIIQQI